LLGIAAAVYLLSTLVVMPAYDNLKAAPAQVAEKSEHLRRYRRELLHRGNYDALTADTRRKLTEARTHFFSNDSAGSAELQKIVEDSAKLSGINLSQRTATQTKKVNDLVNEIAMTLSFESTLNQFVTFLSQLQTSPKLVKVRTAQVDPLQVAYEAPKAGELKKNVRVNLAVAGYALTVAEEAVK
jgi:hypothetical protein